MNNPIPSDVLPHFASLDVVPPHLVTRSGLKQLGYLGKRPEPVATVVSYGKTVYLYDARLLVQNPSEAVLRP